MSYFLKLNVSFRRIALMQSVCVGLKIVFYSNVEFLSSLLLDSYNRPLLIPLRISESIGEF